MAELPPAIQAGYTDAYAASMQTVFLVAVPVALLAFALTRLLPEVPLRTTSAANGTGETFAMPTERTSPQEVERKLCLLCRRRRTGESRTGGSPSAPVSISNRTGAACSTVSPASRGQPGATVV